MYLGIEQETGLIYEGSGNPNIPAIPLPTVTQARLIEKPEDWNSLPAGLHANPMRWIFREDSFDAVTRTRRGRLYQQFGGSQLSPQPVSPHPYDDPARQAADAIHRRTRSLYVYTACFELLNAPGKGEGATLALGSNLGASAWRIVQTEVLASRAVMVTLKALSAYGILPEIDSSKIGAEHQPHVAQALRRVLDSAFKESAISVIDHCRDALAVVLSRWVAQESGDDAVLRKDLAEVAKSIEREPHRKDAAANVAKAVARPHPRRKENERAAKGLRVPQDEDAEFALQALGFALREVGWAKPEGLQFAGAT